MRVVHVVAAVVTEVVEFVVVETKGDEPRCAAASEFSDGALGLFPTQTHSH